MNWLNYLRSWQKTQPKEHLLVMMCIKSDLPLHQKNKGKSGGARLMSFVKVTETTVLLFSIYSKGEKDNITDKEIQELLHQ